MDHIFISYARKDEGPVNQLVDGLRESGFEIWQDVSGKRSGIPYSVKWFEVIEEAIFTAAGAIVFNTEAWNRSIPCQKEFQLIQDADIPFLSISLDRLSSEGQTVIYDAARWCREQIFSEENGYCKWMRAGAYRISKNLPIESYFPMGKHPVRNWQWIMMCYDLSTQKNFHGPWVKNLYRFLAKAKQKFVIDITVRIFLGIFFLSMLIWILSVRDALQMTKDTNYMLSTESAVMNETWRVGTYDPVWAIRMLGQCGTVIAGYDKSISSDFYVMSNRMLADFVSRNYPIAFYETVTECPESISGMLENKTSSQYTVTISTDTAQVFIYDKEQDITRQLLLAAVPETYCFDESGNKLVLAAANKVYLYDLYGEAHPSLLTYNFEDIKELFMYKNKVYAITEKEHVIVWDNPLQERKITGSHISSGCMTELADGRIAAVYINDGSLTVNIDNEEKKYPLLLEGAIDEGNIAISPDHAYAAVSYKPNNSKNDRIGIVALSNGELQKTYDTESNITGFIFSQDNTSIITTCYNENGIERIKLETGEIQKSYGETYSNPYSIIEYQGQFLVCDIVGMLTTYDDTLKQVGGYRAVGCAAPQKQLAISSKYDCLLTAGRGGNVPSSNQRTWLSEENQALFLPVDNEPMVATTSVAVTNTGDYAAFGNAGGSIYLWDIGSMEQVWNSHNIPEAVINMLFSNDASALYALGSSGTVYEIDVDGILSECLPANSRSIWLRNMKKAEEIKNNMYGLGLSLCQ